MYMCIYIYIHIDTDIGIYIDNEYTATRGIQKRLVILFDGVKINIDQLINVTTGENGVINFFDWPEPKIKGEDIISYTKYGKVDAYIEDKKPLS